MIQMNSIFFRDIIKPDEPQDCKGGNKGDCSGDQRIDHVHGILTDIQADGRQTGTATAKTAHTGQARTQTAKPPPMVVAIKGFRRRTLTPNRAGSVTPSSAVTPPETAS